MWIDGAWPVFRSGLGSRGCVLRGCAGTGHACRSSSRVWSCVMGVSCVMPADLPRACGHASWGFHVPCQSILLAPVVMRHRGTIRPRSGGAMPPKHLSRVTRHVSCTSTLRVFVSRPSCIMCHARRHFGCLFHARHASPRLLAYRHCDRWRLRRRPACHSVCWQKTGRVGESATALERVGLIPHKGRCDLTLAVQVGAH